MHLKSWGAALTAALAIATLGVSARAAGPATVNQAGRDAMSPQVEALMNKARQARRTQQAVVEDDRERPALTAFNVAPSVDVGVPGSALVVSFKAVDDMSGVQSIQAWAIGPSERPIEVDFEGSFPSTKLTAKMHTDQGLAFLQPGIYRFVGVSVTDYAGNRRDYSEAELETLGKTAFTLKNKKGFDRTAPTLVSGKVLTPRISLSAVQPGTGNGAFAQVSVVATDAGDTVVAGVRNSIASFCSHEPVACIVVESNRSEAVPMVANATLRLGGQPAHHGITVGEYHLESLGVEDYAGNYVYHQSIDFGGQTDFSLYFPSTTITVVP